ncbi:MAG: glycosyltransferase family 2 protein [Rhizobacter sp.]|nr:glycosyltransferase family 2 protein [Rhizobacter sp.]MBP6268352.1 glycosyltransferase family 2 protein [Rhizobacter sp.]
MQPAQNETLPPLAPVVAVLLCSYQGERHLAEQLDSIAAQTHRGWTLWVSDDRSTDGTLAILEQYRSRWGSDRLSILTGPARGFAANFRSLTCHAEIDADGYAWCDQDDVWEPEKLERALAWLQSVPAGTPALYGSRTLLTDEENRAIGMSPLFTRPPCFQNALVQSIAGGNTMVFNRATRDLLIRANSEGEAVAPDWLAYLLVSGCGGQVRYDPWPSVRYRQHDENLSGSNVSLRGRWQRMRMLLDGKFKGWVDANVTLLERVRSRMPEENLRILDAFVQARREPMPARLLGLRRAGVHRQTAVGTFGLAVAALLNRL